MNLQRGPKVEPVRVLVANPLSATTQLVLVKILNGYVFGSHQLVNVILLVYSNEVETAERLKLELQKCAFPCINSIKVSTDLPRVTDADVFCFTTTFKNPNVFNIDGMNDDKQFDTLYLLIKIANGLYGPTEEESDETSEKYVNLRKKNILPEKKALKPIFLADGLVAVDILKSLSHNMPEDVFFCPTPLEDIIESVLAEHLKVKRYLLNDMLIWAADDQVFHAEVDKPLVRNDKVLNDSRCSLDLVSNELLEDVNLDSTTHLTASWLKKELMEKSLASSRKNPYGCIYKACAFAKTLKDIWMVRSSGRTFHTNLGVISDGSVETIKGCAYVLPVIFTGDTWTVNTRYHDYFHVKQEIKRINKAKQKSHKQLIPYCKKFLTENVIYQSFAVDVDEESDDFSPCLVDSSRPSLAPSSDEVK